MDGRWRLRAAAAGIAAVVLGVGAGELAAAVLAPASSPIGAIGDALIDLAPGWGKEAAISLFGTSDKLALIVGIGVVLIGIAALLGVVEARFPRAGALSCAALGVVGIAAAVSRADAEGLAWTPSAIAGAMAAFAIGPLARRSAPPGRVAAARATDPERRWFLAWAGTATLIGVASAAGGVLLQTRARAATATRRALHLPAPARAAPPVPSGAELTVPGLTPLVTPSTDFYRIDTALFVPQIDPASWSLRIHGLVDHTVVLTWDELLALPLQESYTTLACVSNPVGGGLIGNAKWLGYPIRDLLARAAPRAEADMVLSRSTDGFTASTPLEVLTDNRDAVLAVGMNGAPLPPEHGFPVRMVVPGLYGYVSATKWVVDLEVTRFDRASAYWTEQGWSPRGPIKLESRIDVPRTGATVPSGDTVIAGVAWQQHVGISKVEVSVDDGAWQDAELATAISADTWVQWRLPWHAASGAHTIRCRATNHAGEVQTAREVPPAPDGATGWPHITVQVA
ncbi:molybdopterin-dependent oxidoreductase [Microbacterium horticulturae]|uniref:Molybdopterin-dependent oxidoreductase n=1 Tax=Microbacterium horticulturae TaxID=3028316 RepID=A0ABY8BZI8_9MICO|nr:molybdopterin-dependent oxidoreductase [Microbacterium sp. KACC 23027]WEG08251.1 molybdopterin-dependent oxidoreductase [Microbacterium sp. KACC 23027]